MIKVYSTGTEMIRHLVFFSLLTMAVTISSEATHASLVTPVRNEPLQRAVSQFEAGDYSSAITTLLTVVADNGNNAEAYYWLGRCYYEKRDFHNAIKYAKRSAELAPQNSLYHQWLGRAYGGKADREHDLSAALRVQKEFQKAVHLDPANIRARRDLQEFYLEAPWIIEGSEKAREMADAIAVFDPVEGHLARAEYYLKGINRTDLAENEYRLVIKTKPLRIEPYLEVADFYQGRKDGPALEAIIQNVEKSYPSDPRLPYYRAVARIIMGKDMNVVEGYLKSYLAHTPDRSDWPSHAAAHRWLGELYEREGKRGEAAEQYRVALQLDPDMKEARLRLDHLEKPSQ